ncbi:MAG: helix-turn-helix domain-containing protein [Deltaproteobacteria bacterium]|nr:helix-turn-helix domain-containing protein [Deltaproteobacteria bacterium]
MSDKTEEFTLAAIGEQLKSEREKLGQTRSEVASITRLSIDQIVNLEEGRPLNMPQVYIRGFLRVYAEHLNLDAASLLSGYRRLTAAQGGGDGSSLTQKYVAPNIGANADSGLGWPVALILAVAAVAALALWLNPTLRTHVADLLPFGDRPAVTASVEPPQAAETPVAPAPEATAATDQSAEGFSGRLSLKAERTTWSQVTVDDQPMEHIFFEAGQSRSFEGRKSISIVAGDGQALRTEWNGKDFGPLGPEGPVEVFFPLIQPPDAPAS